VTPEDKQAIRNNYRNAMNELHKAMRFWGDLNEYAEVSDIAGNGSVAIAQRFQGSRLGRKAAGNGSQRRIG
jgi:hypothetical protein